VFADVAKRRRLQQITPPRIAALSQAETAAHAARGAPIVVYEAALPVANGLQRALDRLIVVSATPQHQGAPAAPRHGTRAAAAARARLASQLPLADKIAAATHVIDNTGTPEETRRQVERLWGELAGAHGSR